ncbi:MAG: 4Fe-4S binding protein [Candidatus Muirbacterium halophilum]|nr:4Fe-4S binding protein [Candidatus Muirbacterium halophilum]MCK9476595.1 4Fe-4S binding protein [Candidatus Muirbacterium halophilum]
MIVKIEKNICTVCGRCAEICPVEAIFKKDEKYVIDNSSCINCLACEKECPVNAIVWEYSDENTSEASEECDCDYCEHSNEDNDCLIDSSEDFCDSNKCNNKVFCKFDKKVDNVIKHISPKKKKKIIKSLRHIVEDVVAPVVEKAFLLFIDGSERLFKKRK